MSSQPRQQPHSDELELEAVSKALHFPDYRAVLLNQLEADDFFTPRNAEVFETIRAAESKGAEVDELVIRASCSPAGRAAIDAAGLRLGGSVEAVCRQLRALAAARSVTRSAALVMSRGYESTLDPEGFLDYASQEFSKGLASRRAEVRVVTALEGVEAVVTHVIDGAENHGAKRMQPAPLRALERAIRGWEAGRLYVIAARPGAGKTALAMQSALTVSERGQPVLVFSYEMPPEELLSRSLAGAARLNARDIEYQTIRPDDMRRLLDAAGKLAHQPLHVVDAPRVPIEDLVALARREHARGKCAMVVIDYLQLVKSRKKFDREDQEIAEITRECKLLARELRIPVILLSQLNREVDKRQDKRPQMSDLRGSGAIEQDADTILFLYRPEAYGIEGRPEIIVAKQRAGETGALVVEFQGAFTRFVDV